MAYSMGWDRLKRLKANAPYAFRFHLLTPDGGPVTDMQPYLGMAGHAAFVKEDGTALAHTHPDSSGRYACDDDRECRRESDGGYGDERRANLFDG
jgi:hypothetical protein